MSVLCFNCFSRAFEHERDFQRKIGQRKAARPDDGTSHDFNSQPKKKARIISNAVSLKPSFKRQGKPDQPVKRESVTPPHGGCLKCTGPQWLVHGP
ncbi:hypothetical protein PF003_g10771 [Phytophthora fragariae]|nr:hypothetical protein PF003_g10771 [Phytophthora fragariae]